MKRTLAATTAAVTLIAGCSGPGTSASAAPPVRVRLGFVTDLTQAPALVGARQGFFAKDLGPPAGLRLVPFRTSAAEAAALEAGQLDAAYASPDTILSVCRTRGASFIKIVSGAASGGAKLIVKPRISDATQLKGRQLAVPTSGGAQDIALRYWLHGQHLASPPASPAVGITPITSGAAAVHDFTSGRISGAWEPPPYDVEMTHAGGRVLVDEATLWPGGRFATANLVVTQTYLDTHTALVLGLLKGQIQANDYLHQNLPGAVLAINAELTALTGTRLPASILASSFAQITFTDDPIAGSLATEAQHATAMGLPRPAADLNTLYDLSPLDLLLRAAGDQPVSS